MNFIKPVVKAMVDPLGLGGVTRRAVVETRLLGERLQQMTTRHPETILLAGPGRSGTTWLADVLSTVPRTQQIFEPLLFNPEVYRLASWQSPSVETYLRLYYLRPSGDYPEWHALLERILSGRYRTYLTDSVRTSYFPLRYLIKEVRANLMLGYIYDHFRLPIIYATRHPCAVVASRVRLRWEVDLDEILCQEELIEDHLAPWVSAIEQARGDMVASHAIWWALESRVAARDLTTRRHYFAFYEDLVLNSQEKLSDLFRWLNLEPQHIPQDKIRRQSRTTWHSGTPKRDAASRLADWKKRLTLQEQRVILDWAHRLGVTDYDDGALPVQMREKQPAIRDNR